MLRRLRKALRALITLPAELPVRDAYARWAAAYPPEPHNRFMEVEQAALLELLPDLRGARVLDLACGTGRYARIARERGASAAVGLDVSVEMLRRARGVTASVALADLAALPLRSGAFDVIVCGLAVGHLPQLGSAFLEMGRVLRRGGTLVYSDFHPLAHRLERRRTFEVDGRRFAVEHHAHPIATHHDVARAAGLEVETVHEAGKTDDGLPAVLVIRAHKPS
jgi:malonyl-CoA O-methyltransferase